MDANRFDRLTRSLSIGATRRLLLVAASTIWPALDTWAKKGHGHKKKKKKKCRAKCRECNKCSGKRCKPASDGAKCSSGRCSGGVCVADGRCTISEDNVSLVTEAKFEGQALRLRQTAFIEAGATSLTQTDVSLGGASVLRIENELGEQRVITTVTYGAAFQGIKRARFTTDGQTIEGEIDGRAIAPLPVDGNLGQMSFADGGPPLEVEVDPDLVGAVQDLYQQAGDQASACQSAQRSRRGAGRAERDIAECLIDIGKCSVAAYECEAAALSAALSTCNIVPIVGPIVCAVAGTGYCAYQYGNCIKSTLYGPKCCPVSCGGSVDIFGSIPLCCEEGQSCQDPNSNLVCCVAGTSGCSGECCPNGSCVGDICCTPGVGKICGNQCCAPLDSCCGGNTCCSGTCIGGSCCPAPNYNCGGFCCQGGNACCENFRQCCAPGQICDENDQCKTPTTCAFICNGQCCQEGDVCCGGTHCETRLNCPT